MKRIVFLCLAGLFLLSLAGCGKSQAEDYNRIDHITKAQEPTGEVMTPTPTPTEEPDYPYVICLDPGHGGRWEGAIYHKREEREIVLQLCKEIRAYLNEHYPEIEVYLTREDNTVFSDDLGTDLRARVEFAKNHKAKFLVSIHMNASEKHNLKGTMVCISKQPNINGISIELANTLLKHTEALGLKNRGYETRNSNDTFDENGVPVDYYAICRHGASLDLPAVILESCFMDNETDYAFIETDAALKKLAAAEAEAMAEFLFAHWSN